MVRLIVCHAGWVGREHRRRLADITLSEYPHGPDASVLATAAALDRVDGASTIVLVEGVSDQIAIETLAVRLGRNLQELGAVVVPINGAQAVGGYARRLATAGDGRRLVGLCDVGERRWFDRARTASGRATFEFFVCDRDLEAELVRATGRATIESLLESQGELPSFRTLQLQPPWRDQPFDAQFHRWLRAGARRNLRYARLLVDACEEPPAPLIGVLDAMRP